MRAVLLHIGVVDADKLRGQLTPKPQRRS